MDSTNNYIAQVYTERDEVIASLVMPDNSIVSNKRSLKDSRFARRAMMAWIEKEGRSAWGSTWGTKKKHYGF